MRCKIGNVGYESDPIRGTARVIVSNKEKDEVKDFENAIVGWNYFQSLALYPFDKKIRDELAENGFDRWLGIKGLSLSTESEKKHKDEFNNLLSDIAKMKSIIAQ